MLNIMSLLYRVAPPLLIFNSYLVFATIRPAVNSDVQLETPELIRKHGYPVEVHRIITEDGYVLELHRIPHERINHRRNFVNARPPILIQHGLAGSSADWVLLGPENSLAYILADAGYDIWLGNNRGNIYSRTHVSGSPTNRSFWNFSYHELGIYDLPGMIDHILGETKCEKLFYIGHSQGTTQFWVMTSQKPSYNSKIALMVGLAPVAFTGNIRGPVTKLAKLTYTGVWVGETFGYPELRPRSDWGKLMTNLLCQDAKITKFHCSNIMFLVSGFSPSTLSAANLSVIIGHVPAGASWKQVVHYGQGYMNPDHFMQFNYYNKNKNYPHYNSSMPPEYDLKEIIAPVALFNSEDDWLSTVKDVDLLKKRLRNVVFHNEIPTKSFGHYDFMWGKSAMNDVFEPVLQLLNHYR